MAYCTHSDILGQVSADTLIQLTDDDTAGSIDASVIEAAIAWADSRIDAYCSEKYALPFDPVPPVIRDISVDMAVYKLFARRQAVPEDRAKTYTEALQFLRDLAAGKARAGLQPEPEAPEQTGHSAVSVFTRDKTFSDDLLSKY